MDHALIRQLIAEELQKFFPAAMHAEPPASKPPASKPPHAPTAPPTPKPLASGPGKRLFTDPVNAAAQRAVWRMRAAGLSWRQIGEIGFSGVGTLRTCLVFAYAEKAKPCVSIDPSKLIRYFDNNGGNDHGI
jgi:hypothetical protein